MKVLRQKELTVTGGTIPITLSQEGINYVIDIDGVEWVRMPNMTHAVILFEMMHDHVTSYMHYEKR